MSIHWGGRGAGHINRLPRAIGALSPFSGATMLLDFTNPVLDPRITFSRGTNATLVDSTGKITYAPNNLLLRSEEFENASWQKLVLGTGVAPVVTPNSATAPDGTDTADTVVFNTGAGTSGSDISFLNQDITSFVGNGIASIWLKTTDGTTKTLALRCGAPAPVAITVTGSWQRFSVLSTATTINRLQLLNYGNYGNATVSVYVWGAQLEFVTYQTTPGPYNPTTASAYYGPRFDYDPVTLAPRGLLIEEARTNLLTYSSDWTNAAWSKANITVTAAATVSPDGTTNAQRLQATTTAAANNSSSAIAVAATAATYSIYVKQGSSPTAANSFALRNNTTATNLVVGTLNYATGAWTYSTGSTGVTVSNAGNGWWRIQISATTGITSGNTLICYAGFIGSGVTAGDFFYAYGAQLEAGAFATSYIPTVASTVTRNIDIAQMTGTNFSTWYNQTEGAFIVNSAEAPAAVAAAKSFAVANTGNSNIIRGGKGNAVTTAIAQLFNAGVEVGTATTANSLSLGALNKIAVGYKVNDFGISLNGGSVVVDTSVAIPTDMSRLEIGQNGVGFAINGHVAQLAYYNTRLPNTQLQTLTAPSLASPLALDFISPTYTVGY